MDPVPAGGDGDQADFGPASDWPHGSVGELFVDCFLRVRVFVCARLWKDKTFGAFGENGKKILVKNLTP